MKVSRAVVAMVAACLIVGLSAFAPSAASAASGDAKAKSSASKTPSSRTINRRLNTARKQLSSTRKQVRTARKNIAKVTTDLGAIGRRLTAGEGGIALLLGAAPQLISSLQSLGAAVQNQIGPGLTTLANTVRDTIGPGLQRVGDFVAAQEYGAGAIMTRLAAGGADSVQSRTTPVVSPDIPDSGNPASANGTIPVAVSPTATNSTHPTAVQLGSKVLLGAAIRSAEADGEATGSPAGQVGALMIVKCAAGVLPAGPGVSACSDDTTALGGADGPLDDVQPGQTICVVGPTPSSTFSTPVGDKNLLLKNIQEAEELTNTETPELEINTPFTVNPLSGGTANSFGGGTPASGSEGTCQLNRFGLYDVQAQFQFADIPTSASPGPKD